MLCMLILIFWSAGFGFTLKSSKDFKLSDFYAGTPETFNPYYGVNEDGNIFDPANLSSLKDHVLKHTDDIGVHFLMADGVSYTNVACNIIIGYYSPNILAKTKTFVGFFSRGPGEHSGNIIKTTLFMPVSCCLNACKNWWSFCC